MAYNFERFPKKDRLKHSKALNDQRKYIKNEFSKSKSQGFALQLERTLNKMYYGNNKNTKSGYEDLSKVEQRWYDAVIKASDQILQEKFNQQVSTNMYNLGVHSRKFSLGEKHRKRISTIKANLDLLNNEIQIALSKGGMSREEADNKKKKIENLEQEIKGLKDSYLVSAGSNLGTTYNEIVNSVLLDNYRQELGYAAEALVALADLNADVYAEKSTDEIVQAAMSKMVGATGTAPKMSVVGIEESQYQDLVKSGKWNLDEAGSYLIYNQETYDKADAELSINSPAPYYVSVKNYYEGDSADIHMSGKTHLASLLSSSLVLEDYSTAYLRYAGWKWKKGKYEPYQEKDILHLAQKIIAIMAISGKGFQTNPAEILVINRRDTPGFKCYSVQEIANKFLEKTKDGITVTNLPQREDLRPNVRSTFLNTIIEVRVNNLKKLFS